MRTSDFKVTFKRRYTRISPEEQQVRWERILAILADNLPRLLTEDETPRTIESSTNGRGGNHD